MSPGRKAFTIWCIAGSSVGALAPFRARTAGRAVSLRKALALPLRSRLLHLCHRVRHQAPDGGLLRFAAGPVLSRPIPPSAWHGTAGSAKGGGGLGSGREHVPQVRNGCGVPQVHVDPQKGSARGARGFV